MCFGGGGSKPKAPPPPPTPPPPPKQPRQADSDTRQVRQDQRAKAKGLAGSQSTIKTNPLGDPASATIVKKKLGA